ncbi:MAG: beta-propeller fold lactonase family protein [Lachnospiraceae bacterium]|nr:beta-propeller fold lactonase family protein [Lachnospiraceae bacterium]
MYTVFIGTNSVRGSKGIYSLQMGIDGIPAVVSAAPAYNSGYLAPGGGRLFAVSEGMTFRGRATGGVTAYDIGENGTLTETGWQYTDGQRPCCLCAKGDGSEVIVSNFFGGLLHVYPVGPDGSVKEARLTIDEEPRIPLKALHCVGLMPGEKVIGVVSFGRMSFILYDAYTGEKLSEYLAPDGYHPRHFAVSPDGRTVFLLMQKPPVLQILHVSEDCRSLTPVQALPLPDQTAVFGPSAIRVSPDGRFAAAAHRDNNTLYCYAVTPDGLAQCSETMLPGLVPRDFDFTPDGKFIVTALQYSDQVSVHRFENGKLTLCSVLDGIGSPASVTSLKERNE